ncbi:unnamed protein product [Dibothriocephalus latus]|uniref:Uncharacterized protein n=1 Tax=Dibothriocephalus latus TaxID=60516 RepID=A0A3P7NI12_DIBLA|nr:unnamed protein product [Dibothriocephalus latus]
MAQLWFTVSQTALHIFSACLFDLLFQSSVSSYPLTSWNRLLQTVAFFSIPVIISPFCACGDCCLLLPTASPPPPALAARVAKDCSASPKTPTGTAKLLPSQESGPYVTRVQNLVAALGPEYRCLRGHYVPAWCLRLPPSGGSLIGSLVSALSNMRPFTRQLLHLKRVHSVSVGAGDSSSSRSVRVLLDMHSVEFSRSHALELRDQLVHQLDMQEPDVASLQVEPCWIPLFRALSRRQHEELVRQAKEVGLQTATPLGWPSTFHPDPQLELLLAVGSDAPITYFTNEEATW